MNVTEIPKELIEQEVAKALKERDQPLVFPEDGKVELINGYIIIKRSAPRKVIKQFRKTIFDGEKEGENKGAEMERVEKGQEILLKNLIQKAVIDEKEVKIDEDFLDNLDNRDYEKLVKLCTKIMGQYEEKKTNSLPMPELPLQESKAE